MPKHILITGASGLIGSQLTQYFLALGHRVSHLSRTRKDGVVKTFQWNVDQGQIDAEAFDDVDTIIHLAGAGVNDKRWTTAYKKKIYDSRIDSTQLLFDKLKERNHRVSTFICASAIGYYGFSLADTILTETSAAGSDFLATVVKDWEATADQVAQLGIRVVKVRVGVVLARSGGALQEMARPVRLFAGAPLATGRQYVSWIHIDDLCGIFGKAVEDESLRGSYNAVAPGPVTNKELTASIARALHRPLWPVHIPAFMLKLIVGEMAAIVVNGSNVSSTKIETTGYKFQYADIDRAVNNLLS